MCALSWWIVLLVTESPARLTLEKVQADGDFPVYCFTSQCNCILVQIFIPLCCVDNSAAATRHPRVVDAACLSYSSGPNLRWSCGLCPTPPSTTTTPVRPDLLSVHDPRRESNPRGRFRPRPPRRSSIGSLDSLRDSADSPTTSTSRPLSWLLPLRSTTLRHVRRSKVTARRW